MKTLLAALFGALAVGPSFAADLPPAAPAPAPYKAPVVAPAPVFSWTGFYLGINGGYATGKWSESATINNVTTVLDQTSVSGGIAGGQVGFNWQVGMLVLGAEADADWSGQKASFTTVDATPTNTFIYTDRITTFGTVRGRIGAAFDRVLVYGTGGWAWTNAKTDLTITGPNAGVGSYKLSTSGWTAGGGIEFAFFNNLTARLEYLYIDTTKKTDTTTIAFVSFTDRVQDHVFRAGLNYLFSAGPVSARY